MQRSWLVAIAVLAAVVGGIYRGMARTDGPFALTPSLIPPDEIRRGGPGKDGIPALVAPRVLTADAATYLAADDRVLALAIGNEARAYPLRILSWHEVVNDTLGGTPILVTYCPLCGSGLAFERTVAGAVREFGVSGLLYESNVLMYDRTDQGLWSQLRMQAVTGPLAGTALRPLPVTLTTWSAWRRAHPTTTVLARPTAHRRDYDVDPYLGYADVPHLMFPVRHLDERRHAKEWVVGVRIDATAMAYPFRELARAPRPVRDTVGGVALTIDYDPATATARVRDPDGRAVPAAYAFWFAWAAFHPKTGVYVAPAAADARTVTPTLDPASPRALLPLAVGRWWAYEERTAGGDVAAIERWQVRGRDADGYHLRTRQRRLDRHDRTAHTTDERIELGPAGLVRRRAAGHEPPTILIPAPIERGRAWQDGGGRCSITTLDTAVRAGGRWIDDCVQTTCYQGDMARIVSTFAAGVGLVLQEVWFAGFGPLGAASGQDTGLGDAEGTATEAARRAPASRLVLTGWGTREPRR